VKVEGAIERAAHRALYETTDRRAQGTDEEIRSAFGAGRPLSPDLLDQGPINTNVALNKLRSYLAKEIRRLARLKDDVDAPSDMCDVSYRSLQKWINLNT